MALAIASSAMFTAQGCRFAPSQDNGDTVAASEFYPIDTAALNQSKKAKMTAAQKTTEKDSVDMFYIGSGSTKEKLQLVSYPSRRDTAEYYKTRHAKVKGNADIGHVVRIRFYLLHGKDSLVSGIEEIDD